MYPRNRNYSGTVSSLRTIVKNLSTKDDVREDGKIVSLSSSIQKSIQKQSFSTSTGFNPKSGRSNYSTHSKKEKENPTDRIKSHVRNMKEFKRQPQKQLASSALYQFEDKDQVMSRKSSVSKVSRKNSQHQKSLNLYDRDFDIRSVKSNCTSRQYELSGLQGSITHTQGEDDLKPLQRLMKMQERMDHLIKHKLRTLMIRINSKHRLQSKPFMGASTPANPISADTTILQQQIDSILSSISILKERESDQGSTLPETEEDIEQLNKKIILFEKVIASSFTQSEIIKKLYFAQRSQKFPHLNRKEQILKQITKQKDLLNANYASIQQKRRMPTKRPIAKYESTSKYYHSSPAKSAYNISGRKSKPYIPNKQQMPTRSMYGRDFLNYGALPVFNYKPKDNQNCSNTKLTFTSSIYQDSFKERKNHPKKIDYKNLDCFRNKIKPGSLSFAQMYKDKDKVKSKKSKKKTSVPSALMSQPEPSINKAIQTLNTLQQNQFSMTNSPSKLLGNTQMKSEYIWHRREENLDQTKLQNTGQIFASTGRSYKQNNNKYGLTSVIKNQNLDKLKSTFKSAFLR